jgi:hypothetical protein
MQDIWEDSVLENIWVNEVYGGRDKMQLQSGELDDTFHLVTESRRVQKSGHVARTEKWAVITRLWSEILHQINQLEEKDVVFRL